MDPKSLKIDFGGAPQGPKGAKGRPEASMEPFRALQNPREYAVAGAFGTLKKRQKLHFRSKKLERER